MRWMDGMAFSSQMRGGLMAVMIGAAVTGGALLSSGVQAADAPKEAAAPKIASEDPAAVKAGTYSVDPAHTQVSFSVSHFGFSYYYGLFGNASGQLSIDPKDVNSAKLSVSIPIGSVLTTSPKLTDELKSADWLDAEHFPDATFVASKVTLSGKDHAMVPGNLTLHGVTRHVVLRIRFVGTGVNPMDKAQTVGFEAYTEIRRSTFGVTKYLPVIGDEVKLRITGAFELKQ